MRTLTTILLCTTLALSLSACGRKSRPAAPEGSMYPRVYPPVPYPGTKDQTQTNPEAGDGQGTETQSR